MGSINENIRLIRLSMGFSQEYVADQLGITQSAYSNWEIGSRELTYNNLVRISRIFERNVVDIITYSDKINSSPDSEISGDIPFETYVQIKVNGKEQKEVLEILKRMMR